MSSNIKDLNKGNYLKSKNIQPPVDSVGRYMTLVNRLYFIINN